MGHKINEELLLWLREHPFPDWQCADDSSSQAYRRKPYRLHDRLSHQDIENLVNSFKAGATQKNLAKWHSIRVNSVKKLLRERGVK